MIKKIDAAMIVVWLIGACAADSESLVFPFTLMGIALLWAFIRVGIPAIKEWLFG